MIIENRKTCDDNWCLSKSYVTFPQLTHASNKRPADHVFWSKQADEAVAQFWTSALIYFSMIVMEFEPHIIWLLKIFNDLPTM